MVIIMGGLCTGRQISREDFVLEDFGCLLLWEDFVPGGKCPGRILGVYYFWRILYREANVPGRILYWKDFGVYYCGRILYPGANVPGGFCVFIIAGGFCTWRIFCREANMLHPRINLTY